MNKMNPEIPYQTAKAGIIGDTIIRTTYHQSGERSVSIYYSNRKIGGMATLMLDTEIIPKRGLERKVVES